MAGIDVATRETLAFALTHLRKQRERVLEVGCGDGVLAAALRASGHDVVAIDISEAAVERACARGVDARVACFPEFNGGPYDALLFTRSLHHINDLEHACVRARELLTPEGVVIVEDWCWDELDRTSAEWIYGLMNVAIGLGLAPRDEWTYAGDPLAAWIKDRIEHRLNSSVAMRAALERALALVELEYAPYVYRYFVRYLRDDPRCAAAAEAVLAWERRSIELGSVRAVGWRVVARAPQTPHGRRPQNPCR